MGAPGLGFMAQIGAGALLEKHGINLPPQVLPQVGKFIDSYAQDVRTFSKALVSEVALNTGQRIQKYNAALEAN